LNEKEDAYSIVNKTDTNLNQTVNYVNSGFVELQNLILNTINEKSKINIDLETKQFPLKSSESIFASKLHFLH
jgi:hypothetical protein